jgi:hypothetical protein
LEYGRIEVRWLLWLEERKINVGNYFWSGVDLEAQHSEKSFREARELAFDVVRQDWIRGEL